MNYHRFWTLLPTLTNTVLLVGIFWFISYLLRRIINQLGETHRINKDVINFASKVVSWSVLVIGAVGVVGALGIDLSAVIASLGLTGFAVGLALKDVISNAVSGMIMLASRCFEDGDLIEIGTFKGVVRAIDLRYTILTSEDNTKVIYVPNSNLSTQTLVVYKQLEAQKTESGKPDSASITTTE